mgnify:CR=1 FL=1
MQRKKSLGPGGGIRVAVTTAATTTTAARAIAVFAGAFIGRPVFALWFSTSTAAASIAVTAAAIARAGPVF